ncbi:MAG: hypothetical protein AAFN70_01520 [Planctomycetota bacterium]
MKNDSSSQPLDSKSVDTVPDDTAKSVNADCPNGTCGVCIVCGSRNLMEIRGKLHCNKCHAILETCCEGGPD